MATGSVPKASAGKALMEVAAPNRPPVRQHGRPKGQRRCLALIHGAINEQGGPSCTSATRVGSRHIDSACKAASARGWLRVESGEGDRGRDQPRPSQCGCAWWSFAFRPHFRRAWPGERSRRARVQASVRAPIAQRFGQVGREDMRAVVEIGDRPRHPQDAVDRTRG